MRITASTQPYPPSPSPIKPHPHAGDKPDRLLQAGRSLQRSLEAGQTLVTATLREALNEAFGASGTTSRASAA
jgi:hypothetical protein